MKLSIQIIAFIIGLALITPLHAQKLSFGGKMGSMVSKSEKAITTKASSAGVFARYSARKFKLGLQVELNYRKNKPVIFAETSEFQLPVLGLIALDKKDRIHLQAGPYIGIGSTMSQANQDKVRNLNWGLTSGVDVRLPINKNMSLITDARLGCQLNPMMTHGYQEGIATHNYALPLRRQFSFNLSIGIAFKSGKKKSFRLKKEINR